jgi:hypothetical protein
LDEGKVVIDMINTLRKTLEDLQYHTRVQDIKTSCSVALDMSDEAVNKIRNRN